MGEIIVDDNNIGGLFAFSEEVATLKQSETTLKQQNVDSQRRERLLVRRLATKEQEMQDYMVSIERPFGSTL